MLVQLGIKVMVNITKVERTRRQDEAQTLGVTMRRWMKGVADTQSSAGGSQTVEEPSESVKMTKDLQDFSGLNTQAAGDAEVQQFLMNMPDRQPDWADALVDSQQLLPPSSVAVTRLATRFASSVLQGGAPYAPLLATDRALGDEHKVDALPSQPGLALAKRILGDEMDRLPFEAEDELDNLRLTVADQRARLPGHGKRKVQWESNDMACSTRWGSKPDSQCPKDPVHPAVAASAGQQAAVTAGQAHSDDIGELHRLLAKPAMIDEVWRAITAAQALSQAARGGGHGQPPSRAPPAGSVANDTVDNAHRRILRPQPPRGQLPCEDVILGLASSTGLYTDASQLKDLLNGNTKVGFQLVTPCQRAYVNFWPGTGKAHITGLDKSVGVNYVRAFTDPDPRPPRARRARPVNGGGSGAGDPARAPLSPAAAQAFLRNLGY